MLKLLAGGVIPKMAVRNRNADEPSDGNTGGQACEAGLAVLFGQ